MCIVRKAGIVLLVLVAIGIVAAVYLFAPAKGMGDYAAYYADDASVKDTGAVSVTFFGVSTLLVDDGRTRLMIDGFFSRPALWRVLTSDLSTDTALVDGIASRYFPNGLAAIFVAHSHYEHALDAAYIARKTNAVLLGSVSTCNIGLGGGLTGHNLVKVDDGREYSYGDFAVKVLASKHSPAASYNDDLGKVIATPLEQPARARDYTEGGSFDFLITHRGRSIYVKSSANYVEDKLREIRAEVLFLSVGGLANQDSAFMDTYYRQTVGMLGPKLVIPLHWDNFFEPMSGDMRMNPRVMDKTYRGFDHLIDRTRRDGIAFKILQGGKRVVLFKE